MKENKYDDPLFFEKYSQMDRSKKGLDGAGEWKTLENMLPDFQGKKVLDLGCGYGWHCEYAADHGAAEVTGVDISEKMLEEARKSHKKGNTTYICCPIEDIDFEEASFDIILSSLAFHYIENYEEIVDKIHKLLKPGGYLVFSAEHPVFTAEGSQDWYYDENGKILHFPVDNYYYEGKKKCGVPGRTGYQVSQDIHHIYFRSVKERVPACGCRGASAAGGNAEYRSRNEGRNAPAHDVSCIGTERKIKKKRVPSPEGAFFVMQASHMP